MVKMYSRFVAVISVCLCVNMVHGAVDAPVTSGLLIGLDGSDVTSSGGKVSSWNDQAALGGNEDFVQATAGQQPTLLSNVEMPNGSKFNVLDFDKASPDQVTLSGDSEFITNTFTVFSVMQSDGMEDGISGYMFMAGNNDISTGMWGFGDRSTSDNWILYARDGAGSMKAFNLTVDVGATGRWHIVNYVWDGVSGAVRGRSVDESLVLLLGQRLMQYPVPQLIFIHELDLQLFHQQEIMDLMEELRKFWFIIEFYPVLKSWKLKDILKLNILFHLHCRR